MDQTRLQVSYSRDQTTHPPSSQLDILLFGVLCCTWYKQCYIYALASVTKYFNEVEWAVFASIGLCNLLCTVHNAQCPAGHRVQGTAQCTVNLVQCTGYSSVIERIGVSDRLIELVWITGGCSATPPAATGPGPVVPFSPSSSSS